MRSLVRVIVFLCLRITLQQRQDREAEQTVELTILQSVLNYSVKYPVALYDGDDTVYVLGGTRQAPGSTQDKTLEFSISEETVNHYGQLPLLGEGSVSSLKQGSEIGRASCRERV